MIVGAEHLPRGAAVMIMAAARMGFSTVRDPHMAFACARSVARRGLENMQGGGGVHAQSGGSKVLRRRVAAPCQPRHDARMRDEQIPARDSFDC